MRVIISGPVTAEHLADAELLAGITPTSFVTNGLEKPPAGSHLPVEVFAICPMQPVETRVQARHFTLVQNADALICAEENEHLLRLAKMYDLLIYEVE